MRTIPSLAIGALLLLPITQSRADSIDICNGDSTEGLGAFTGTLTYTVTGQDSATLLLSLTNTSDPSNGGYITAIAFYDNGLTVTGYSSSSSNFEAISGPIQIATNMADADFGASATTKGPQPWLGGGSPTGGIAVGDTVTFTWTLSGNVSGLSAGDFAGVLVRFRGFDDGGSDKVVGKPCGPGNPVPEPSSIALAFLGAGAVLARRRKHAQAEQA